MDFYFRAASVLDRVDAKHGSVKGLLASLPDKDRKRTAALVIETLKYRPVLTDVIVASQLLKHEKKITSQNLALLLVHDLLLASSGIQAGDGPIKQAVVRHKTRLNSEFQRVKVKRGVKDNEELVLTADARAGNIPRYVRVNTLKWTVEEAIATYKENGFELGDLSKPRQIAKDAHIPNLLIFPAQTSFQDDPAFISGRVILQDKASCFPAVVLAPPASDDACVIDATAAPGNKTSHLSALMRGKGTLIAFERDSRRFKTLKNMLAKAGCKNVSPRNADFLSTDPKDGAFANVTHILLDPSCSGSGIMNRLDHLLEAEREADKDQESARLAKLASFQLLMIRHAMKFPAVKKIVYSTCSVHVTEDECVVLQALKSSEATTHGFVLAPRTDVLPTWSRRGKRDIFLDNEAAESVVRCSPGEDATNGFFVSCFVRHEARKRKAEIEEDCNLNLPQKKKPRKKKKNGGGSRSSIE
ncbi:S-adenosyl-L-methionine-dependent methyltransferase [Vararia minispora EC-137]|uniref:S-adenosyl-L-methionine-dependent methyltransferase n=1 Tax=Vararia minispora EC-137 TaxID=1314806 RepID=A0ACB8QLK0_9AGAM|nr:S-adenosyl-L-methionine-dependent methyltransferase [Vararia minispora EC-137]